MLKIKDYIKNILIVINTNLLLSHSIFELFSILFSFYLFNLIPINPKVSIKSITTKMSHDALI